MVDTTTYWPKLRLLIAVQNDLQARSCMALRAVMTLILTIARSCLLGPILSQLPPHSPSLSGTITRLHSHSFTHTPSHSLSIAHSCSRTHTICSSPSACPCLHRDRATPRCSKSMSSEAHLFSRELCQDPLGEVASGRLRDRSAPRPHIRLNTAPR